MMRTVFTREHNTICDRLRAEHPMWDDDELFGRARLINAALIAKIHTVEWTPAVISHPTTKAALRANWFGVAGERVHQLFGRISDSEVISGIPGGATDHYGVPYALTEEFVAVYRMHPLIRDNWPLRSAVDDTLLQDCGFRDLAGPHALELADRISMTDLFYSFGTLPPGLVTLHNFPKFLQEYERPDGHFQDLAATDILRSRELGVPRYNAFRRLLHLPPATDFTALTDNPAWAAEIERVYRGDIEQVDLVVGMFAERRPAGFAFSDTAFRIFILMASRRLNSDRFFTEYYTPAVYTQAGLDWIKANSMATVLMRTTRICGRRWRRSSTPSSRGRRRGDETTAASAAERAMTPMDQVLRAAASRDRDPAGIVSELMKTDYTFPRVAGTSVGAIDAAVVAARRRGGGHVPAARDHGALLH